MMRMTETFRIVTNNLHFPPFMLVLSFQFGQYVTVVRMSVDKRLETDLSQKIATPLQYGVMIGIKAYYYSSNPTRESP
jgi:hypothetical protein